jgi:MFS family permease
LIGTIVFGLFISLLNGASQALLYDHLSLSSMTGHYGKQQGTMYALFLIGAGIANFVSGFMAHGLGLRAPFYLSIIPSVLTFLLLLPIHEPPLAKGAATKWYAHLREVWNEIRTNPRILLFGIQFAISTLVLLTVGEFGQIYMLSFGVSTIALGILWSIDAVFAASGRFWAHRMQSRPRLAILIYCAVFLAFVCLHSYVGILLFWMLYGCNEALANIAETEIQDETKSSIRATLLSSVSFFGNILAVPAVYCFNRLYVTHSIFTANTAVATAVVGVLILSITIAKRPSKTIDIQKQPIVAALPVQDI